MGEWGKGGGRHWPRKALVAAVGGVDGGNHPRARSPGFPLSILVLNGLLESCQRDYDRGLVGRSQGSRGGSSAYFGCNNTVKM